MQAKESLQPCKVLDAARGLEVGEENGQVVHELWGDGKYAQWSLDKGSAGCKLVGAFLGAGFKGLIT